MYRQNYNSVTISKYFLLAWQIPSRAEGWPAQPLFGENCTGHIHKNKCFLRLNHKILLVYAHTSGTLTLLSYLIVQLS